MQANKIIITGGTGFLGSSIVQALINTHKNAKIIVMLRPNADLKRLNKSLHAIQCVEYGTALSDFLQPEDRVTIIHAAWAGVSAKERSDWQIQLGNLDFLQWFVQIQAYCTIQKIVALGSQAEYGIQNHPLEETDPCLGKDAYATAKLAFLQLFTNFCAQHTIACFWLRVFSVFGPGEDKTWFIPFVIQQLQNDNEVPLTKGEQAYDYLYIEDFAAMVTCFITTAAPSGIYNICSGKTYSLRYMAENLGQLLHKTHLLQFGALPYRVNQPMFIGGNPNKFHTMFKVPSLHSIEEGLYKTVQHYSY